MRPLSYSQISRYQTCPLWYKLQYVDRLKPKERFYLSFGDIIHQCAEHFYKIPVPPPPTFEKLIQFYEMNWISQGYESPEQEQQYKEYGKQLLSDFHRIHSLDFKMPLAVEQQFYINIQGVTLGGKIDRIDKLPNGGVSIVDYKTSKDIFTSDHLEQDLQLTFYQLAVETMWKMPVKKLTLYHLRSNTPCTCSGRSPERLEEARQLVLKVADGITKGVFPAVENSLCAFCDFPEHCPYQKHKYSKPEAVQLKLKEPFDGKTDQEIVERYAVLQNQKKEIEAELDELKQMICEYCEANDFNRVYGKDHALTYKIIDRNGFEEEKVKAILEPEGFWSSVLKFDSSLVKALLDNKELPPELRKKLETAKNTISSSSYLYLKKLKEEDEGPQEEKLK
jgi:putative RecB family exonuclease